MSTKLVYHVNIVLTGTVQDHHWLWNSALGARSLPHLANAWRFVGHGGAKRRQALHLIVRPHGGWQIQTKANSGEHAGGLSQTGLCGYMHLWIYGMHTYIYRYGYMGIWIRL